MTRSSVREYFSRGAGTGVESAGMLQGRWERLESERLR